MIFLPSTSDKVQVKSNSAATLDVTAHYSDNAAGTITFGKQVTAISSSVATDVLAAPAGSTTRKLKFLSVRNKDAAIPASAIVQYISTGPVTTEMVSLTLAPGDTLEYMEGAGFYLISGNAISTLIKVLTADDTGGQAVNTVQPWFPTTGGVTVAAATTYRMKGHLWLTHGATSHSTGLSFGGTATLTSIDYRTLSQRTAANTAGTPLINQINVATNVTVDAAGTQAATYIEIEGIVRINAGGTLIPQYTFSANPTGTITTKRNSRFELQALPGDNTLASIGTWA